MEIKDLIRNIEGFPTEGINFKDITPLLRDKEGFRYSIKELAKTLNDIEFDLVVGPEARGFLVGAPLAYETNTGFVPVRKPGKLPYDTISHEYELEYGTDKLEMHKDAIEPGQKVVILDDLLATGGTVYSTIKMVEELGGEVVAVRFLIELEFLKGRDMLKGYDIDALIKY
ncbi:adenine phosphoribosyltransferase [Clostridiisalibacter paucivorans]|uniref:adenine phosphoribosyltransferase n=1 Tax=Clostridiisalibacter paucivorans TaxID=408753 RepID=UPI0004792596|nr:adenine phosphoribosyltransferase [Clostridiisalibacter paucivorans]